MNYTPTNNLLFLKCFASVENSSILQGFIQDILGMPVEEATVENPYDIRHVQERLSYTAVDVLARLGDESLVSVEMQVAPQKHFAKRALYYAASRYISGYGDVRLIPTRNTSDALYASLRPLFGINICDFELFGDHPEPLRTFRLFDTTYHVEFPGALFQISFLQLGKEEELYQGNLTHWLSFFKGRPPADDAPGYILQAYQAVAYANLTTKEREMMDYAEMNREDAKAQLLYARDEGIAQGLKQGISQAASRMLAKGMTLDDIRDITELDVETIRRLEEN
jgi:predicted transposase/invertase (TIGR01784 family)